MRRASFAVEVKPSSFFLRKVIRQGGKWMKSFTSEDWKSMQFPLLLPVHASFLVKNDAVSARQLKFPAKFSLFEWVTA
jgi:hypothetical protein